MSKAWRTRWVLRLVRWFLRPMQQELGLGHYVKQTTGNSEAYHKALCHHSHLQASPRRNATKATGERQLLPSIPAPRQEAPTSQCIWFASIKDGICSSPALLATGSMSRAMPNCLIKLLLNLNLRAQASNRTTVESPCSGSVTGCFSVLHESHTCTQLTCIYVFGATKKSRASPARWSKCAVNIL